VSLIDDLRTLAVAFPPSHTPSPGEVPGVLGALVTLIEHGPDLLTHLDSDYETVAKFVSGEVGVTPTSAVTPVTTAPAVDTAAEAAAASDAIVQLQRQNAELQNQISALLAVQQRTTVGEPVNTPDAPASAPVTVPA
jgi:hypothetical protein